MKNTIIAKLSVIAGLKDCVKSRRATLVIAGLTRNLLAINHSFMLLRIKSAITYLLILIISGCTEPFYIQTDDADPRIVIYGVLTDHPNQQEVHISSTAPYFSEEPNPPVRGAKVSVTSSDGKTINYEEAPDTPGHYYAPLNWQVEEGKTYTLKVEVDFDKDGLPDLYEATTEVPMKAYLDSIDIAPITIMGHENYALNIYGQDSLEEQYYLFNFRVNGDVSGSKLTRSVLTDDIMFNGEYIDGLTIRYFDNISEYEKDSEERREESVYLQSGDLIEVETCLITKGYYNFILQCMNEKGGENPMFGGPPSNITTNISNGGIGYFTAYPSSLQSGYVK